MKIFVRLIVLAPAIALLALAQPKYRVTDLGPAASPFAQATSLNGAGQVGGFAVAADGAQHAMLWIGGRGTEIPNTLGGPNSGVFGVNSAGDLLIQAETQAPDPNHENFCGFGTGLQCVMAVLRKGVLIPMPGIGGTNSGAGGINNRGLVAGWAEAAARDPNCSPEPFVTGNGPQVLNYQPILWDSNFGQVRILRPVPGDSVGLAMAVNDEGQAVGITGLCSNTALPGFVAGPHAVFWDKDGSVVDVGSLGGTSNPRLVAVGNAAMSINNRGQVVGTSAIPGDTNNHPFLWTRDTGIQDLGLLDGDNFGAALSINNAGEIVGASISGPGPLEGNPRAALWSHGQRYDLNDLVGKDSPLYLLTAFQVSDAGQIVGFGATEGGDLHGFLASPTQTRAVATPKEQSITAVSTVLDGSLSVSADGKPLSLLWTIPQGAPTASISRGDTASPIVTFPLIPGVYTFQLTVTDSTGATSSDIVTVHFRMN